MVAVSGVALVTVPQLLTAAPWSMRLVAPCFEGSSWVRDGTCVFCTGRWIPYHEPPG